MELDKTKESPLITNQVDFAINKLRDLGQGLREINIISQRFHATKDKINKRPSNEVPIPFKEPITISEKLEYVNNELLQHLTYLNELLNKLIQLV